MTTQREVEYRHVMDLYVRVIESMAGVRITRKNEWLIDCENLAIKLFYHVGTLNYLARGTKLPKLGGVARTGFVDHSSIAAVTRSALQTYLTFYYIFIAPHSDAEKRFRYKTWELSSLIERQPFHAYSLTDKKLLRMEGELAEVLLDEIQADPIFQAFDAQHQEQATQDNLPQHSTWAELARLAGFDPAYFNGLYRYLSSHIHSGRLGTRQIGEESAGEDRDELTQACIGIGLLLMGHFIFDYAAIVPQAQPVLDADPFSAGIAREWNEVGRSEAAGDS